MWSVCLIFPSSLRLHEGITVSECLLSSERESTETVHTPTHAPAPLSLEARSVRLPRGKSLCCMESTKFRSRMDGRVRFQSYASRSYLATAYHLTPALLLQFTLTLPYETDHITVDGR